MNTLSKETLEWVDGCSCQHVPASLFQGDREIASGVAVPSKGSFLVLFYPSTLPDDCSLVIQAELRVLETSLAIPVFRVYLCSATPAHFHCNLNKEG